MTPTLKITAYSNRWQGMILVLQTLHERIGTNTKQEVIDHITRSGYYDVTKHDLPSYENKKEPKYHTLLAWARKDAVMRDLILNNERDAWALSLYGRRKIEEIHRAFANGTCDVRKCYLWTQKFKKKLIPSYEPSGADSKRPEKICYDLL
ncbi:hypothetical protein M2103_002563 [Ereboglobus sp. PH5-5]|uniref:hypothetical protein n=1 Tax=Ereboglobus sp. PH5-5 TaxID=2940529 RepID=UPI00240754E7|nr:hypothetical protein [Ereboglobus sp. PH5-5]MDF9834318.1 hypothetical protein [Ereboglobus sp. PH5-5]